MTAETYRVITIILSIALLIVSTTLLIRHFEWKLREARFRALDSNVQWYHIQMVEYNAGRLKEDTEIALIEDRITELREELQCLPLAQRLRSALENWGWHLNWCASRNGGECDCGLKRELLPSPEAAPRHATSFVEPADDLGCDICGGVQTCTCPTPTAGTRPEDALLEEPSGDDAVRCRRCAKWHSGVGPDDIAADFIEAALAASSVETQATPPKHDGLCYDTAECCRELSRVWKVLGVETYADAKGKSVHELVAERLAPPSAPSPEPLDFKQAYALNAVWEAWRKGEAVLPDSIAKLVERALALPGEAIV